MNHFIILRDGVPIATADYLSEHAIAANPYTVIHPSETAHINAEGAVIIVDAGAPCASGFSDVRDTSFKLSSKPDGKGGWILPPNPPAPDATSVPNWKLSAALAAKGVSFAPVDPTIAARWQYEPSFAIDGAVATALKESLGYDASQLQALFNEAAALK